VSPANTWESVIGLEVHVQLDTASKIFSGSSTAFGAPPNAHTDPVVLGLPGALPVFNAQVLDYALRLGLATGCEIRRRSRFARKQYFYPDLPKGYQISQYDEPLCEHGHVDFAFEGAPHRVRLTRIHLEEDAGKNVHAAGAFSLVDLNRAGVPLCEVVSEPDIRSGEEAAEYLRALRQLVRYLGISDGNMEQGSLRCDANVSIRKPGDPLGTRVELKNINSFRFVQKAIEYEIARQTQVLEGGGTVVQETRLWDSDRGVSLSMRSKEEAEDYRYFPDPDLPPLVVADDDLERARDALPELPAARVARLTERFGLSLDDARAVTAERDLADYFDAAVTAYGGDAGAKPIANWMQAELARELNQSGKTIAESPVQASALAELVKLINDDVISGKIAKKVFGTMVETGDSPADIVKREGLEQITDTGAIEAQCQAVVDANPGQVEAYRGGKTKLLGFFVGQVMKQSGGKANPAVVNQILKKLLEQ